jgi:hypothetical protein
MLACEVSNPADGRTKKNTKKKNVSYTNLTLVEFSLNLCTVLISAHTGG